MLARMKQFLLPEGEAVARGLQTIRIFEKGEMRMSEQARWMPFTSEQTIQTCRSGFRWDARTSGLVITDAYEEGHGFAMSRLAGLLTLKKATRGPELDRGEVQRYLASLLFCPAAIVNHPSLEWTEIAPSVLRVRDVADPTGATVDFQIEPTGEPSACRTIRPRLIGKNAVDTPWLGKGSDFRLWNSMRVAHHLEVWWEIPEAPFCYYRSEVTRLDHTH